MSPRPREAPDYTSGSAGSDVRDESLSGRVERSQNLFDQLLPRSRSNASDRLVPPFKSVMLRR